MSDSRSRIAPGITMPTISPSVPNFPSGGVSVPSLRVPENYGVSPTAQNPLAAVQSAVQTAGGIQQYRAGQITLRQAQQADRNRFLVPVLQNPNATEADLAQAMGRAHASGADISGWTDDYHSSGMSPFQYAQSQVVASSGLAAMERLRAITPGAPQPVQAGSDIWLAQQAPPAGIVSPAGRVIPPGTPVVGAQPVTGMTTGLTARELAEQVNRPAQQADVDALRQQGIQITVGTPLTQPMLERLQQQGVGGLATSRLRGPSGGIVGGTPGRPDQGTTGGGMSAAPPVPPPPGTRLRTGYAYPSSDGSQQQGQPATSAPGGVVVTGNPPSFEPEQDARLKDVATLPQQQTDVQNMKRALDALRFITTGKSQENVNGLLNWLQPFGVLPAGATSRLEQYEEYRKLAIRQIMSQGFLSGNTDFSRELSRAGNPDVFLSDPANRKILRNDIGKWIQSMAPAAIENQQPASSPVGYLGRRANISQTTDPRGFAWSLYSQPEQQQILNSVKDDKAASDRLHRAIGMADMLRLDVPYPTGGANIPQP